ncbi:MAG: DUF3466 family protein [Chloroflexota bacterium]|nr:DUF3466 family protein [Chloroflexota bacterium]
MSGVRVRLVLVMLLVLVLSSPGSAVGAPPSHARSHTRYIFTDLGTLPGGTDSRAFGINSRGEVVGNSFVAANARAGGFPAYHAFLYSNGKMRDLGTLPGDYYSAAYGINDRGDVVGESFSLRGNSSAFLYRAGHMYDLGRLSGSGGAHAINSRGQVTGYTATGSSSFVQAFLWTPTGPKDARGRIIALGTLPGAGDSAGTGINDRGQIAGYTNRPDYFGYHAFVWTPHGSHGSRGVWRDLGTLPGGTSTGAWAINDQGEVAGTGDTASGELHGFLYSKGEMIDLGTLPGGTESDARGINNRGEVVGTAFTAEGHPRAFLYRDGKMVELNDLLPASLRGVVSMQGAFDINDRGQIVGVAAVGDQGHAFLLTPVP